MFPIIPCVHTFMCNHIGLSDITSVCVKADQALNSTYYSVSVFWVRDFFIVKDGSGTVGDKAPVLHGTM